MSVVRYNMSVVRYNMSVVRYNKRDGALAPGAGLPSRTAWSAAAAAISGGSAATLGA